MKVLTPNLQQWLVKKRLEEQEHDKMSVLTPQHFYIHYSQRLKEQDKMKVLIPVRSLVEITSRLEEHDKIK